MAKLAPLDLNAETGHLARQINIACAPSRSFFYAETFDRAECPLRKLAHDRRIPPGYQPASTWYEINQTAEGELNRIKVAVDVRVVELDIIENDCVGQVVHELRPFIEVGCVVLVSFNHEIRAVSHSKRGTEILGYSA